MFSRTRIQLSVFILSSFLAFYFGFLAFDGDEAYSIVRSFGYWVILLTVAMLACSLLQVVRANRVWRQPIGASWAALWLQLKRCAWPALFVLVMSVLVVRSQEWGFKIIMDELVLVGTSMQMHFHKLAATVMRSYEVEGVFELVGAYVDKRPLFFPFVLSLVHDFTGYRPLQGVYFNLCLTPIFLGLVYVSGCRIWPKWGGYVSVTLVASIPLFAMSATSGGFELLNLSMILIAAITAVRFIDRPSGTHLNVMLLTFVLLAQVRYESALFVGVAGVVMLTVWYREQKVIMTWTAAVVPLLLIIYGLQRILMEQFERYWEIRDNGAPFDLAYIGSNWSHALSFFFHRGVEQPNNFYFTCLFLASFVGLLYLALSKRIREIKLSVTEYVFFGFGFVIICNFMLLLSYHWGQLDDIVATRIVLPLLLFQVLFICYICACLKIKQGLPIRILFIVLLFTLTGGRSNMAQTSYLPWSIKQAQIEYSMEVAQRYDGVGNPLIISDMNMPLLLSGRSSTMYQPILAQPESLAFHMELRTFTDYLVIYILSTRDAPLEVSEILDAAAKSRRAYEGAFEMEMLEQRQINEFCYIRLSRITEVKGASFEGLLPSDLKLKVNHIGEIDADTPEALMNFSKALP